MDFGLGIHGEPGISTKDWMSAEDLAVKLTDTVLAERPGGADGRAAVLLNGLGATKYEELAALFGSVADLLSRRGVELVMPEVGELVTSLDMAGCSLTVTWLDDELARLWTAPAATPAFRRGALDDGARFTTHRTVVSADAEAEVPVEAASEASMAAADVARRAVEALHCVVEKNKDMLGQIDAVAGDGDHGTGMSRGSTAAARAAQQTRGGAQTVLSAAGAAFADSAGGTSGILLGNAPGRNRQKPGPHRSGQRRARGRRSPPR